MRKEQTPMDDTLEMQDFSYDDIRSEEKEEHQDKVTHRKAHSKNMDTENSDERLRDSDSLEEI